MSRQLELLQEERQAKRHAKLVKVLEFGLIGAFGHTGDVLTGFSVKLEEWECLMTIRAVRDGVPSVAFVASLDLVSTLLKAEREAIRGKLVWRVDKYTKK